MVLFEVSLCNETKCSNNSVQVWAPEDKSLIGGQYDKRYTRGVLVTKYITETDSTMYDSIIIHILYGKMGGMTCDRESRTVNVDNTIVFIYSDHFEIALIFVFCSS
jgi:hypothetical protein